MGFSRPLFLTPLGALSLFPLVAAAAGGSEGGQKRLASYLPMPSPRRS